VVLRPDLERLGRFDPIRVRQRFLSGFETESTRVVMVDEVDAGSLAIRREAGCYWLEHFYLKTEFQGTGIGSAVLKAQLAALGEAATIRLNVLQGSRARGLYDRFGFTVEREDPVDVFMVRAALETSDARCGS
jgi:GNAT superfamily N-acetyltransferase